MSRKRKSIRRKKQFWTPERLIVAAVILLLVATLVILSYNSRDKVARTTDTAFKAINSAPRPPAPAAPAPPPLTSLPTNISAVELKAAKGSSFKLADFSGKVLLVNLWATWCGPCRSETPELVKLHKQFRSRGVEMIGLSTENPETSAENVRKFVHDFEVDYRIGWAPPEVAATLMQGRDVIPQSFVISREGRILEHFVGFSATNTATKLKQVLEEALNDKK
jgi:peroxiredoxin